MKKINELKIQQDADYALTARLMEPFGGNLAKSKVFQLEFHLKQKKSFTFRNKILEIGGDILISDELFFNNSKYILFLNGDAMGKSIQGACGALALGVINKSILTHSHNNKSNLISPEQWLSDSFAEMHRIFESFEGSMLVSVFMGLINEKTGELFYINTEHPSAILYRDECTSFLTDKILYRKIGSMGMNLDFNSVDYFQLTKEIYFLLDLTVKMILSSILFPMQKEI